jgi:hypothetical protein
MAGAGAQTRTAEAGGYVKYLFTGSDAPGQEARYDHLLHGRLNARWYPSETITGVMEVRARAFYGGSVRATPHFAETLGEDAGFGKLGVVLWDRTSSAGYAEMDRLYLNVVSGPLQFTAGRQRIAWGTNLVWNPVDLFNPQSVLDFDHEEKPAVDAVRVQYYTGEVSKVEAAYAPETATRRSHAGVQWTGNRWDYDMHLMAGVRGREWYGGCAWAGDIAGGGFRGEVLVSEIPSPLRSGDGSVMVSAGLSGDYTFQNSFYIHTEALYNSEGVTEGALFGAQRAAGLGLLSPARWSLFQEFSYDISPLVRGGVFAIYDPSDHSAVVFPSLTWSVVTDLDLSLFALLFSGDPGTEYGQGGSAVVLRLKWSY